MSSWARLRTPENIHVEIILFLVEAIIFLVEIISVLVEIIKYKKILLVLVGIIILFLGSCFRFYDEKNKILRNVYYSKCLLVCNLLQ